MKTVLLLTLACLLLSGCIIVVEQPRDAKPAAVSTARSAADSCTRGEARGAPPLECAA